MVLKILGKKIAGENRRKPMKNIKITMQDYRKRRT